ncbi:hypothetical protein MTR67_018670 [Solanum verrucosum]|uniref:Reverse transcriptase RNase H-like domain-containing protein n=1 Tax=Solanum verrucosum TaxID=315347 RepID=A0AAF0TT84_SOLVR|nr:hypothetical protein MTR67_018670 [Solanum verrucosum]
MRSWIASPRLLVCACLGCLSYIAYVRDTSADTPPLNSVLVVREFADLLPTNLNGLRLDRDIDFGINIEPECEFQFDFVVLFGHVASKDGIMVQPIMIVVVRGWDKPTSPSEHGRVISNASRQLELYAKNYPTHDLELATLVFMFKIWRYYSYGVHMGEQPMASNSHSLANQIVRLDICESDRVVTCIEARSSFMEKFWAQRFEDPRLTMIQDKVLRGEVLLWVPPMKVVIWFRRRGKLSPMLIDSFDILKRIRESVQLHESLSFEKELVIIHDRHVR